jgi:hypothetical protein
MIALNTIKPALVTKGDLVTRKDMSTVSRPLAIATNGEFCVKVLGNFVAVTIVSPNRVEATDRKVEYSRHAKMSDLLPKEAAPVKAAKPKASTAPVAKAARLRHRNPAKAHPAPQPKAAVMLDALSAAQKAAILKILGM